jgi:regulatory protein
MLQKHSGEPLDAAQAFRKAADYCASQEHCITEVRMKMKQWGISNDLTDSTIDKLIDEGYIEEQRYASAFARGKFRLFDWGKIKIASELKMRRIPSSYIARALDEINENEYFETIKSLIGKKLASNHKPSREEIAKVMNFMVGKGYEIEFVRNVLNENF